MSFSVGVKNISATSPVYIVAEGADAHLGSVATAKEMILQAKLAGADAIKWQHHLPDEEMLRDIPSSTNMQEPLYDFLERNALSLDQHVDLKKFSDSVGIQYICTPFSYKAADELYQADLLDVIKIGSGEMTDIPSLVKMAKFGKPMIVSTGMATLEEIDETYDALIAEGVDLVLMNCVSEYPPKYDDINLYVIETMIDRYPKAQIGHSDHTPTLFTAFGATMLGARVLEKHVILDKRIPGPDQSVSIDFRELQELVQGVRILEAASGSDKKVHADEAQIRAWAFRSVVTTRAITKGTILTQDMLWSKRPGTGIPAKKMTDLIGMRATKDIKENVLIRWEDVE